MGILTTVLITILIINVIVLAHEWGHYLAARQADVPVQEFSIGFGWRLFALRRRETVYSLRILPLGGYVLLDLPETNDNSTASYTPGKKITVALGGPLMNLGLALLIFIGIYCGVGMPHYSNQPVIGRVIDKMPAGEAGIHTGDIVLSVNQHPVNKWTDLTRLLGSVAPESSCSLVLQRGDKTISCRLTPTRDENSGRTVMGVEPELSYERKDLPQALAIGFTQTFRSCLAIISGLAGLVTGAESMGSMAGPIGLAGMVGDRLAFGWLELLGFTAFLSINLGIFNLLPIPFLDGGRILLAAIEAFRRRALDPEKEAVLHWLGLAFLMVLMLYASYQDIVRLL
ncbi:MAG: RIP metalloprotease RseP [Deltaproteobacteria bacterium]